LLLGGSTASAKDRMRHSQQLELSTAATTAMHRRRLSRRNTMYNIGTASASAASSTATAAAAGGARLARCDSAPVNSTSRYTIITRSIHMYLFKFGSDRGCREQFVCIRMFLFVRQALILVLSALHCVLRSPSMCVFVYMLLSSVMLLHNSDASTVQRPPLKQLSLKRKNTLCSSQFASIYQVCPCSL
jgi:hypothetical protein